jgi:hypothetical protein
MKHQPIPSIRNHYPRGMITMTADKGPPSAAARRRPRRLTTAPKIKLPKSHKVPSAMPDFPAGKFTGIPGQMTIDEALRISDATAGENAA